MARDLTKLLAPARNLIVGAGSFSTGSGMAWDQAGVGGFPMFHAGLIPEEMLKAKLAEVKLREIGGGQLQAAAEIELDAGSLITTSTELDIAQKFSRVIETAWFFIGDTQVHVIGKTATQLLIEDLAGKTAAFQLKGTADAHGLANGQVDLGIDATLDATKALPWMRYNRVVNGTWRSNLSLEVYPYLGNLGQAGKLYDASENRRTFDVTGATWNTTPDRLTFDGVNDHVDLGNILNDDASGDFLVETWVRILAANGTTVRILGKKNDATNNSAGWAIYRHAGNALVFAIANGTTLVGAGTTALLQNTWGHFAVAVDRDGNVQAYLNGAASGSPVAVGALSSATNALSLRIGRDEATYGNFDLGAFRVYRYGAGGLPASIAQIVAAHFNTERSIYGV